MNNNYLSKRTLVFILWLMLIGSRSTLYSSVQIIPQPLKVIEQDGSFRFHKKTTWALSSDSLRPVVTGFLDRINRSIGWSQKYVKRSTRNCVLIRIDPTVGVSDESYRLKVSSSGIELSARTLQGVFYGLQSLMQLLPATIEGESRQQVEAWMVPSVTIDDTPALRHRGMMLDVGRHFHSVEFIKKQLDVMALYKMNRFHWHLTEDHLWTIESKKYPRLTEVGSRRTNADGSIHQGFYSQEEIREVVRYAAERFITVIPEVELPGHALAALTAYPELSCTGGPFQLRNKWGVEENVYCAGNENTFLFLKEILEEIIPLFPGAYFHIGGDECPKSRWQACSKCQQRIREEGLKDEHELQSYFIQRIEKVLTVHGKKMIGWDEILEGGVAPTATVMSWRGEEGGIAAANMGHDVIMTPARWFYLDFGQGGVEVEPITINFTTTLERTYSYNPYPAQIPASQRKHILGVQGNMWTEYAVRPDLTEYMLYPRLLAVAEVGWTPVDNRNYPSFVERLNNQWARLDAHRVNYHIPIPEGPEADYICVVDSFVASFTNSRELPMVYTLDRTEPSAVSARYTIPLVMRGGEVLQIATLLPTGRLSRVRTIRFERSSLQPSFSSEVFRPGLYMQRGEGNFYFVGDTQKVAWSAPVILNDLSFKPDLSQRGVYCYTGYFEVPQDGVYCFSTEMDQLDIDGQRVLSNDGQLIRHSRTRTTLALAKGFHSFRLLMINTNVGGFPRCWNNPGFIFAPLGESMRSPDVFYHALPK